MFIFQRRTANRFRCFLSHPTLLHGGLHQQQKYPAFLHIVRLRQHLFQPVQMLISPFPQYVPQPPRPFLRLTRYRLDLPPFLINHFRLFKRVQRHGHFQGAFGDFGGFCAFQHQHIGCQSRSRLPFLQSRFTAQQRKHPVDPFAHCRKPCAFVFDFFLAVTPMFP
ncbi:Uncharacterised protein [Neisseria gonorrhoeae]|nr:Uncharacterised protein [Neisseria gonorrhoeae]